MELRDERNALAKSAWISYDACNFPGSADWREQEKDAKTLADFDAAHPEVFAAIEAENLADAKSSAPFWN